MTDASREEYRPLLPTLRNEAFDRALRDQLRLLRDRAPEDVARRIDEVLAGRRSLRGLAESAEVDAFLSPLVQRGLARTEDVPADEARANDTQASELRDRFGDLTLRHGGRAAASPDQ